jgi:hypothetical protein
MHRFNYALVFALAFSLIPACGDDDGGGESLAALCERACSNGSTLACPNDGPSTCATTCEEADELPEACRSPARVALECAADRPASDWACDEDGEAALMTGICGEEGNALLVCLIAEDGTCPYENDDECDDPTGTAICPAGTDLADCAM